MKAFYTPSGKKVERAAIYCRVSGKGQEDNRVMTTRSNVMPWRRKSCPTRDPVDPVQKESYIDIAPQSTQESVSDS